MALYEVSFRGSFVMNFDEDDNTDGEMDNEAFLALNRIFGPSANLYVEIESIDDPM